MYSLWRIIKIKECMFPDSLFSIKIKPYFFQKKELRHCGGVFNPLTESIDLVAVVWFGG